MNLSHLSILFGIIMMVFVSGCTSSDGSNTDTSSPSCTPDWQCSGWSDCKQGGEQTRACTDSNGCGTMSGKPAESQACQFTASIGDAVDVDNLKYTVVSATSLPFVGNGMLMEEADGIFILLTLSIENTGKDSEYLNVANFELNDYQGRSYDPDTGASIYLNTMGYDALIFDNLGPGLKTEGSLVFDVPADDKGLVLEISGGLFSGSTAVSIGDVGGL